MALTQRHTLLRVLSLKCILSTNAKQQNETISDFIEGSGLKTSKWLPVRDTFVLPLFHCLAFLVPSQSYRHLKKTQRKIERSGGGVGERVGDTEHTENLGGIGQWATGYQVQSLTRGLCTHCCLHSSLLDPRVLFFHCIYFACYFAPVQAHTRVQMHECA